MREHYNGMYRTDVYFLSKTFAEVPIFLVIPILFTSIMYYMVGLNPKLVHFLTAVLFVTLVSLVAVSFGKCVQLTPTERKTSKSSTNNVRFLFRDTFYLRLRKHEPDDFGAFRRGPIRIE